MYYWTFKFLEQLFLQNQDALLAIPTEIKTILTIAMGLWVVSAVAKGMTKMAKYIGVAIVLYFGLTYFGII